MTAQRAVLTPTLPLVRQAERGGGYLWQSILKGLAAIPRSVEAHFIADIAHLAGLIAAGLHPSAVPIADIVTSSTHKTLTGPRGGGMILCRREYAAAVDRCLFPLLQGAPVLDVIAARAALFQAVATTAFRNLMMRVVDNARTLAAALQKRGLPVVTGGTDTHLMIVDLRPTGLDGTTAETRLANVGIISGKVPLPGDTGPAKGIRLGTVVATQRGMGPAEMKRLAEMIATALSEERAVRDLRLQVRKLAHSFPVSPGY